MTNSIEIQITRSLDSIIPEWQDLFARCPDATPFQSPAWLVPWWHAFGAGDPVVVAARRRDRLVGLGLFYVYDGDRARPAQLFFLGKSVSDYLDILIDRDEQPRQVAQAIFDRVFEIDETWQFADFDRLRATSPVLQIKAHPPIWECRIQEGVCPEVELKGTAIRQIVTKNTRNAIRKHLNRARTMGSVEFVTGVAGRFDEFFHSLVRFHSARWQSPGVAGIFSNPNMTGFLREAGSRLLHEGILEFPAMLLNGVPVAVAFGMLHRDRHYFYLCDFDAEYVSISPGTSLTAHAMEEAARRGAKYFDFLQGEEQYKYQKWAAQPRYTYRIQYSRRNAVADRKSSLARPNSPASVG